MPNWCEGTLKVRGKVKNLKRFCLEGLKPVDIFGEDKTPLQLDKYGDINYEGDCWIENSYRGFVDNPRVYLNYLGDEEDVGVICLNARFAWCVKTDGLVETCKKYEVDMKIYAFEMGMQFNQDIEIVNGEVVKDEEIKFDDYTWECPCPMLGG